LLLKRNSFQSLKFHTGGGSQVCVAPLKLERHHYHASHHDIAPRLANRLAKEFAGLAASLPLTQDGAVSSHPPPPACNRGV
jgi:hypothetical protein